MLGGVRGSHCSLERANRHLLCEVSDEKPFKCLQCESSFRKSSGLKQHVTRQHSQHTPQKSTQAQTNQSSKKNSSANDRPYACQVTPKTSSDRKSISVKTLNNPDLNTLSGNSWSPIAGFQCHAIQNRSK